MCGVFRLPGRKERNHVARDLLHPRNVTLSQVSALATYAFFYLAYYLYYAFSVTRISGSIMLILLLKSRILILFMCYYAHCKMDYICSFTYTQARTYACTVVCVARDRESRTIF